MTDIKKVSDWALTIAAEAAGSKLHHYERMADDNRLAQSIEAHARAIERHEAFRQEVSDAVEGFWNYCRTTNTPFPADLDRFIIAKPDPLVEVLLCAWPQYADRRDACSSDAKALRAALDARGLAIVAKEAQP